jgi:hypothetical protein
MKLNELYKIVSEISQDTIQSAARKMQNFKDRNPVATQRSDEFSKKVVEKARSQGKLIFVSSDPNFRKTIDAASIILKTAEKISDEQLGECIQINVDSYNPYVENIEFKEDVLLLSLSTYELFFSKFREKVWLENRNDAEALSKFIFQQTKTPVSWKYLNFSSKGRWIGDNKGRYQV